MERGRSVLGAGHLHDLVRELPGVRRAEGIARGRLGAIDLVSPMMALRRDPCTMMSYLDGRTFRRLAPHRRWAGAAALITGALLMAGCSGGASSSGPAEPTATPPAASPSGSLELTSPKAPAGAETTYTGVLRSDAIEGGCAYVQTVDGQKYEVIPPDGWQLQKAPAAVVDRRGRSWRGPATSSRCMVTKPT